MLMRSHGGNDEILTLQQPGVGSALPVFSHREEAELFLQLGTEREEGWTVTEVWSGELAEILLGPYRHVGVVTLDPLPEVPWAKPLNMLASIPRADFVRLMHRRAVSGPR
jgi:hypothetical protein